jgi:hypothetical protein
LIGSTAKISPVAGAEEKNGRAAAFQRMADVLETIKRYTPDEWVGEQDTDSGWENDGIDPALGTLGSQALLFRHSAR